MKRLEHAEPPECLLEYKAGRDDWGLLSKSGDAEVVRRRLYALQGGVCAYCEIELKTHTSAHCHIEHFAPRSRFAKQTFSWVNLLLSCNYKECCGHHKGNQWSTVLVNPARDEPADDIDFLESGLVRPHGAEGSAAYTRGRVSIDILNLDSGRLRKARAGALKLFKSVNSGIADMLMSAADDDPDFVRRYVNMELEGLHEVPFAAPVRHFLRNLLRKLTPAS